LDTKLKILIAEDEEEIAEILSFIVKSSIKCEVALANNGQVAIDYLSKGDIDLIICDYNMPLLNGGAVYNFVLNSMPSCKYVMCSSDTPAQHEEFKNQSSFYGHIQKPNLIGGSKAIIEKFKTQSPLIQQPSSHSYTQISPKVLLKISAMPSDVFLKLNENKYVKVFNEGAIFDETDFIKYSQSSGDRLYAFNISSDAFIDSIRDSILKTIKTLNPENKVEANLQVHYLLATAFKEYGIKESLFPLVDVQIKESFELCKTNKTLSLLLDKLLRSKESYLGQHSFMLAAISVSIAEKMEWNSTTTGQKLVVASMFHDIFLKETFTSEMINVPNESKDQDFWSHSQKAADLLDKIPNILPDTSRIIAEHHEVGEGVGFPRGIPVSKTTPLSQVFTFSHYVVDLLLESHQSGRFDKDEFYAKLNSICEGTDKYKKILTIFRSIDFFE